MYDNQANLETIKTTKTIKIMKTELNRMLIIKANGETILEKMYIPNIEDTNDKIHGIGNILAQRFLGEGNEDNIESVFLFNTKNLRGSWVLIYDGTWEPYDITDTFDEICVNALKEYKKIIQGN